METNMNDQKIADIVNATMKINEMNIRSKIAKDAINDLRFSMLSNFSLPDQRKKLDEIMDVLEEIRRKTSYFNILNYFKN